VKFWDTSALVPLLLTEPASEAVRSLYREDSFLIVWWATRVEAASALARAEQQGLVTRDEIRSTLDGLRSLWRSAVVIQPTEVLADRAERLLLGHRLRAADACQLAAALIAARERPRGFQLVTLDCRLRQAAELEGFSVLPA